MDLSMGLTGTQMKAFADDLFVAYNDAAYPRVGSSPIHDIK